MVEQIKVGVVGCGGICKGTYMENMVNKFAIIDVVGACDQIESRAKWMEDHYPGVKAMSLDEMMNDPEIQVIVNLTYPESHVAITKMALEHGKHVKALFGAMSAELLEWTKPQSEHIEYYTDDGTLGIHGFVTQNLCDILRNGGYDRCAICGPEKMMKIAANEIIKSGVKLKTEISMERYMKCGLGLCGSCVLDDTGDRVCTEGPVFAAEEVDLS